MKKIHIRILGTGTSSGVPLIACKCPTCLSDDPRDKRLRCSVLIQSETTTLVIDSGADFRQQMLSNKVDKLDAIVFTHHHNDHISGFDDVRAFNYIQNKPMPIYLNEKTLNYLKQVFSYAFEEPEQIGGGVPQLEVNMIDDKKFTIGDIDLEPIPLMHGNLEVFGFRLGNFAYCTDTNFISEESMHKLQSLDILILDALRYNPHPTHFTVAEALEVIAKLKPKKTYLTHIAHQLKHEEAEAQLPENVFIAYDGLDFEIVV